MRALITGGAGFKGTNLIKRLKKEGHEVISIDNYYTGNKDNHQPDVEYLDSDIREIDFNKLGTIDIIYHLAALARIQPSFDNPVECFDINATGTLKLVDYASNNNIPIFYAGTSSKHSGKFKNPYTFTKDIGEDIIKLYQEHYGLKGSIARFYNVYGPHQLCDGPYCTVIGIWIKALEDNQPLLITGDGEQRRDFTHVYDIVDALYRMGDQKAYGYEFELGRGRNNSLNELIEFIKPPTYEYIPARPGEARSTLNADKTAYNVIGWDPKINIEDYIANGFE